MAKYLRWAEMPERQDVYTWEGTTRWGNHDLYPIPKKERNYGILGYYSYLVISGVSITGFTAGSAYVSAGLSVSATCGAILLGSIIAGANSYLGGQAGVYKSLGYTMMTRATFGLWGFFLPLWTAFIGNIVFTGIQAYYGGQALTLILGAIIPQFHRMENTLPASAAITTRDLIGFLLYFTVFVPIIYFYPIYKLKVWLNPTMAIAGCTLLGILGWIINENGGTGPIISSPVKLSRIKKKTAFKFLQAVSSTAAVRGGSGDRLSDWTRFAKHRHAPTPAMLTGLPISLNLTAAVGALATSAFYEKYGTSIWSPLAMMLYIQGKHYTPACRAGTFFAGVGLEESFPDSDETVIEGGPAEVSAEKENEVITSKEAKSDRGSV